MLKISIITVCFNAVETIEESIQSIVNQDYKMIEFIVIDGKSTDGTLEIIEKYKSKIQTFISEPDNGLYDAINKGIRVATGDIVGLLHADDVLNNNQIISKIANIFSNSQTDCIYGDLIYETRTSPAKTVRYWKSGIYSASKLKKGWMPPHPTFYTYRIHFQKYGLYDTQFKIAADYDLMMRFLGSHHLKATYLSEVIVRMKIGGVSNKSLKFVLKKSKEDYKIIKKNNIGNFYTLLMKNFGKLLQFVKRC